MPQTITSREFTQNPRDAQRAAEDGPVIVTDHGEPAFVLLKYEAYRRLSGGGSIVDLLRQDEGDFDFNPPRLADDFSVPADIG